MSVDRKQREVHVGGPSLRRVLVVVTLSGFGLRLWWSGALGADLYISDPDGYAQMAHLLVGEDGAWRWNAQAVEYAEFTKAPLYQTSLSFLLLLTPLVPFPRSALVMQAVVDAATVVLMYSIGRRLHSRRAGVIAAAAYALWIPDILVAGALWQEQLYVPLIMAGFAAAARASGDGRPRDWLIAGAVFGLAALTRSTMVYFMVAAVAILLVSRGPRPPRLAAAAALLVGFVVVAVPYITYISHVTGRLTIVESIGFFSLKRLHSVSPVSPHVSLLEMMRDPSGPPTGIEALRFLSLELAADPIAFAVRRFEYLRLLMKPSGGSLLANTFVPTATDAVAARIGVHALIDLPFALAMIAAPLGLLAARGRLLATLLGAWALVHIVAVASMLWAGARFRFPVEPAALLLAAVAFSQRPQWSMPRRATVVALAGAALTAWLILLSVPGVVSLRAGYGVRRAPTPEESVTFSSAMGAYVTCAQPALTISLEPLESVSRVEPAEVSVMIDGEPADRFLLSTGRLVRRYGLHAPRHLFLEIRISGRPVSARLGISD